MDSNNGRVEYLDLLKVISAFAVIIIHVLSPVVAFYSENITSGELIIYKTIKYFCSWAVPCFVMITGALLLNTNKEIGYKLLLRKYLLRIIYAIILFGFFYAWLEIIFNEKTISLFQLPIVFYNILTNKLWDHMWYLYMLIGLYLILPILKGFIRNVRDSDFIFILIVLFISNSILPWVTSLFNISLGIQIQTASIYIFYTLIGYYLSINKKINKKLSLILIFIPLVFDFLISCNICKWTNYSNEFSYNSPMVVMMAIGIFSLIQNYTKKSRLVNQIARISFAIYLIHPLYINIVLKLLKINPLRYNSILVVMILMIIIPITSILTSIILYKIPVLRKYVL